MYIKRYNLNGFDNESNDFKRFTIIDDNLES